MSDITDNQRWEQVRHGLLRRAEAEGLIDVAVEQHDTPLGTVLLGATADGVVRVGLPTENLDELLDDLARRVSLRTIRAPRAAITTARHELDEYFQGARQTFDVALDWRLTSGFRRDVLRVTALIPYGDTASYKEVAGRAGSPRAVRAAGTALATNPLPIIVPCHRVLRTGGQLGNYGGGPEMKAALLHLEGAR